jgi:DNA-directed RNA polymerase specialized sigma24 family protein
MIFDRYADHIYSYCLAMVGDRDLAEDAATDAFLMAAARLEVERPERLRPWLFRLARDEARENGGGLHGVIGDDETGADFGDERDDLRHLVLEAVDGLGERDRQLMILHLVESLEGDDLAEAIGGDPSDLDVVVERMRSRVEGAVGPVLLTRLGNKDCAELASLLDEWSGRFDGDVRSAVSRHLGGCESCRERRALLLSPASALPGILLVSAPSSLRRRVLGSVEASGADVDPAPPAASPSTEWVNVAVFVGVSILLGLIGIAVSARYEPLSAPISAPSTFIAGESSTTTSVFPSATTTPGDGPGTTVTPSAAALIEVSAATIDSRADGSSAAFSFQHRGQPAQGPPQPAVRQSSCPRARRAGPGATATLEVALDRGSNGRR